MIEERSTLAILSSFCDQLDFSSSRQFSSSPSSVKDVVVQIYDFVMVFVRPLVKNAGAQRQRTSTKFRFWDSTTAHMVYCHVFLALLLRRWWILHGACLILVAQILWIVLKWVVYILDDQQLDHFMDFVRSWIDRFLREGERILQGQDAVRYIMAGAMLKAAPTGLSYFRMLVRAKTSEINNSYIEEYKERIGMYKAVKRMNYYLNKAGLKKSSSRGSTKVGGSNRPSTSKGSFLKSSSSSMRPQT